MSYNNIHDVNTPESEILALINDKDSFIHQQDSVLAASQKIMDTLEDMRNLRPVDFNNLYPLRIEPEIDNALYSAQLFTHNGRINVEVTLMHLNPHDESEWIGQVISQIPLLSGDNHVRLAKFFAKAISEAKKNLDGYDPANVA